MPANVQPERTSRILAKRLSMAMELRGMTPKTLADAIGASPKSIYAYTEEGRLPRMDFLVAISEAMGVSLDWLAGRRGIRHGAWIPQDGFGEMCQCTECGTTFRNFSQDKFCRECGAKMDGGKKDE